MNVGGSLVGLHSMLCVSNLCDLVIMRLDFTSGRISVYLYRITIEEDRCLACISILQGCVRPGTYRGTPPVYTAGITGTGHFGNFGTTSIPVPDTSVSSVRCQYRYQTPRYKFGTSISVSPVPVWMSASEPVPVSVQHRYRYRTFR